ncbi:MAG: hypothetical protein LR015_06080 [Verrucomicrobia bacterium]|nr:hypothetical protein [Verrucomicrobiota bacterium]
MIFVRAAFDTLRKALQHRHDFDQWIAIFGNPRVLAPDSLIPFSVQQSQRQIQLFEQYMALRSDQIPDAFTIRSKAEQADSQEMRSFLTGLSDLRTNTTDLSLEVNLAKRAAELPHIVSMTPGASPETVSVLFTSLHQPVAFQIIGLGTRRIMVQVEPFTYPIFLRLLARDPTEFEVFYYEVDKLQPLPFSPSMEPRVIPRPRWQFVGEASLALPAFDSPDSMPLFVMVPKMARLVAESLGMRLPHTDELPAIFANSTPTTAAVSFSSEERRLLMSHSRQFSVYKDKIQSPSDLGGLDFVRNRPSSGIIGLHGGAAELAWDGNQFYAAGGSWLWYQHNTAQQPVRITSELDPYIDLSFRLVTEAPPPGFQEALPIFMQTVFQNSGR